MLHFMSSSLEKERRAEGCAVEGRELLCLMQRGLDEGSHVSSRKRTDGLRSDEPLKLLTKGDNNAADDTELYARGQDYLDRKGDVIGSVVGYIPFVGYVTILLSEHPWLKTAALGLMGVMVVLQRE